MLTEKQVRELAFRRLGELWDGFKRGGYVYEEDVSEMKAYIRVLQDANDLEEEFDLLITKYEQQDEGHYNPQELKEQEAEYRHMVLNS